MATILSQTENTVTISVTIPFKSSLLECEQAIVDGVNGVGMLATEKALESFDADGQPIRVGDVKFTARYKSDKRYQTPYAEVLVNRHVYQRSQGGRVYVPF